jgi:hypothetical protein
MSLTVADLRVFGFGGSLVTERRIRSARVTYILDLDDAELDRRRSRDVGAIVDRATINALWELPADINYPAAALPAWVVERARKTPAVDVGEVIRRNVRPPLAIRGAVASGARLPTLLDVLGPLSSVCPIAVVLASTPQPHSASFLQAKRFGVGVAVRRDIDLEVVLPPEMHSPELGAYQWHVAEVVYDSIVSEVSGQPTR